MTLKNIKSRAKDNWTERADLIATLKSSMTPALKKKIMEVDDNFIRKLYNFPGDITTHRIYTVLTKIGA